MREKPWAVGDMGRWGQTRLAGLGEAGEGDVCGPGAVDVDL